MTTAMTLFQTSKVPAYLKTAELDDTTRALMGSGGSNRRISIKGNVFRMIVNGEEVATNEDRAMNIVVVAASPNVSRTYYAGAYKEGAKVSPVCWSADGVKPASEVKAPQCSTCANCPQNIKGSGNEGAKACRYSRHLAVVLDGDMEGDVYQLTLPATSIFGKGEGMEKLPLEAYVRLLASNNVPVTSVVTEMRFDTKSPVPKLTFRAVRYLEENEWESCRAHGDSEETKAAIAHTFTIKADENGDAGESIEQPKPKAVTKPKPAPAVEEDGEEVSEPVKVSKKPAAAAPAEKPAVADLLDAWADD